MYIFLLTAAVLYYYLYKRTAEFMGDPRLYEDSLWLRDAFARARQWRRDFFLRELKGSAMKDPPDIITLNVIINYFDFELLFS